MSRTTIHRPQRRKPFGTTEAHARHSFNDCTRDWRSRDKPEPAERRLEDLRQERIEDGLYDQELDEAHLVKRLKDCGPTPRLVTLVELNRARVIEEDFNWIDIDWDYLERTEALEDGSIDGCHIGDPNCEVCSF